MAKRSSKKVSKKGAKVVRKAQTGTKMEKAMKVYQDLTKRGLPRKAVIEAFMNDVKLSKAGASTYFQLIRTKLTAA